MSRRKSPGSVSMIYYVRPTCALSVMSSHSIITIFFIFNLIKFDSAMEALTELGLAKYRQDNLHKLYKKIKKNN